MQKVDRFLLSEVKSVGCCGTLALGFAAHNCALEHIAVGKFKDALAVGAFGCSFAIKGLVIFPGVVAAPVGYAGIESSVVVIPRSILHAAESLGNASHYVAVKALAVGPDEFGRTFAGARRVPRPVGGRS